VFRSPDKKNEQCRAVLKASPADVNKRAVMIARIATGEADDAPPDDGKSKAAQEELGRVPQDDACDGRWRV
jgi:hypothetical protein